MDFMGHVDFEESPREIIELHLGDLPEKLHFVTHLCIKLFETRGMNGNA